MPWREVSVMEQRREFVRLAMQAEANRRELCRRFGISPEVGYKWIARWASGDKELADRSRRPHGGQRARRVLRSFGPGFLASPASIVIRMGPPPGGRGGYGARLAPRTGSAWLRTSPQYRNSRRNRQTAEVRSET